MKLNNRGWGTLQMFLLSFGILIALLVVVYFISQFYGSLEKTTENNYYFNLENRLVEAARDYVKNNNISIENEINITYNTLKENGYISNFNDQDGSECNGYVNVYRLDLIPQYKSYITCKNYKTYERIY